MVSEQRFWEKVDKSGDCWVWTGAHNEQGYGTVTVNGTTIYAHRIAWQLAGKRFLPGLVIDHLCRTPSCVRVDHMELVTVRENTLRGYGVTAQNARKTHCSRGHELIGDNVRPTAKWNGRVCRQCNRDILAARRARRRAAREAA